MHAEKHNNVNNVKYLATQLLGPEKNVMNCVKIKV